MSSETTTETGSTGSAPDIGGANTAAANTDAAAAANATAGGPRTNGPPAPVASAAAPRPAAPSPGEGTAPHRAPKPAKAPKPGAQMADRLKAKAKAVTASAVGAAAATSRSADEPHTMADVAYQQPDETPGGPQGPPTSGQQFGQPPQPGPRPAANPGPRPQAGGQPRGRKARLRVAKVDPWSVMKTTFVLSIAFAIISIVAVALLWSALNALGVFDSLNHTLSSIAPAGQTSSYTLSTILSFGKVLSFTALVSVVNIVLLTALATLGAYLYNACSALVGGIEVTLADDTS